MRRFFVLLRKELRELITPQVFVPFIVVIVMFAALGQTLSSVGGENRGPYPVVVADADGGPMAAVLVEAFEATGFEPTVLDEPVPAESVGDVLADNDAGILVQVPEGFSEGLGAYQPQELEVTTRVRSFSFVGNGDVTALSGALGAANVALAETIASSAAPGVPTQVIQQPVTPHEWVMVGDRRAETPVLAVMSFVSQQTTLIPIVLFIVIMFASQMIATAVATEKENKTLETLLSYPVSRASIVTAKMVAAALVALMSAAAYMIGMRQYMGGLEEGLGASMGGGAVASEEAMRQLGLTLGPSDYLLLGLTLFAGILVALSMAIILGAFAESVKSVQSLLTPVMVLILVPYFLTLFLDLSVLPDAARYAVMAIPFTYPFITGPSLFLGNEGIVWFGIAYQLVWFAVFVTIAARVFSSDRVLTMKLSLKRR